MDYWETVKIEKILASRRKGGIPIRRRNLCIWEWFVCLLLWGGWLSCGDSTSNKSDTKPVQGVEIAVHIQLDDKDVPSDYAVAALLDNERSVRIFCQEDNVEEEEGIVCNESGVQLRGDFETLSLTVKAHGYTFSSEDIQVSELPVEGGIRHHTVSLLRLSPFEENTDYRTGFSSDELDVFKEFGFQSMTDIGFVYAVKFVITDLDTDPIVYFQNTNRNPIHYDFVRSVLGINISSADFWDQAYSGENRTFMAGTVMLYDSVNSVSDRMDQPIESPIALTFFPSDDLTVSQARLAYRLIEERLGFSPLFGIQNRFFYLPAGDNQEQALAEQSLLFERWDAKWVLRMELYRQISVQIMNPGLSYGTLRLADMSTLETEVFSFKDILILPGLPIQLPIVGGTITEEFQTPLCHVNIMARNRGTPNITLQGATSMPEVTDLLGALVRFEVTDDGYSLTQTTLDEAEAFWASTVKESIVLTGDTTYDDLPLFSEIGFDHWIYVGAKAANLAELHQLLGDNAPYGFAIPFYYYDQHMENTHVDEPGCIFARLDCDLSGRSAADCEAAESLCATSVGDTLFEYVNSLLQTDSFVSETTVREATLAGLRYLVKTGNTDVTFSGRLNALCAEVFGSKKLRLRSSTNAEDIPGFSGAGLYDSVGAYAVGEDRASLEIRKVWASVWNWRAFEERSFWNIDHLSMHMGVAVNQAFENEAANGVLITQNIADPTTMGMYVNVQKGEVSVTNPEGDVVPEIFSIIGGAIPGTVQAARLGYSSLSPSVPIMSEQEITDLYTAAMKVQMHFAGLLGEPSDLLVLDLEFKLIETERTLVIKQARPFVD